MCDYSIIDEIYLENEDKIKYYLAVLNHEYVFDGTYEDGKRVYTDDIVNMACSLWGKDGFLLNQTFHKSFNTVLDTKEEKLFILNQLLELFKSTIYRQTMFAEFEKEMHKKIENDEVLTYENISEYYYKLNKKYFGKTVILDELIKYEWERIPHFFYNFYVYKYATGLSAAITIASDILNGKESDKVKGATITVGDTVKSVEWSETGKVWNITASAVEKALKVDTTTGIKFDTAVDDYYGTEERTLSLLTAANDQLGVIRVDTKKSADDTYVGKGIELYAGLPTVSMDNGLLYLTKDNVCAALGFEPGNIAEAFQYDIILANAADSITELTEGTANPFINFTSFNEKEGESSKTVTASIQLKGSNAISVIGDNTGAVTIDTPYAFTGIQVRTDANESTALSTLVSASDSDTILEFLAGTGISLAHDGTSVTINTNFESANTKHLEITRDEYGKLTFESIWRDVQINGTTIGEDTNINFVLAEDIEDVIKYLDKKESREKLGKFFGGVIFVFFVFFSSFYMLDLYMGAKNLTFLKFKINPEFGFIVNGNNEVVYYLPLNDDAVKIYNSDMFKGMNSEEAVSVAIEVAKENNYLLSDDRKIEVTVVSDNENVVKIQEEKVVSVIEKKDDKIVAEVVEATPEEIENFGKVDLDNIKNVSSIIYVKPEENKFNKCDYVKVAYESLAGTDRIMSGVNVSRKMYPNGTKNVVLISYTDIVDGYLSVPLAGNYEISGDGSTGYIITIEK